MTHVLNRTEQEVTHRTSDRAIVIDQAKKDFSQELAMMTDHTVVLSLSRKELFEQVEYIVSEMLRSRRIGFSNQEQTNLTGFVVDDLIRSSLKAVN